MDSAIGEESEETGRAMGIPSVGGRTPCCCCCCCSGRDVEDGGNGAAVAGCDASRLNWRNNATPNGPLAEEPLSHDAGEEGWTDPWVLLDISGDGDVPCGCE